MTTLEWFRFFAPEYASVSDVDVAILVTATGTLANLGCLTGDNANAAIALYAAHLQWMKANASGGLNGSLKMRKEGDLAEQYVGRIAGDNSVVGQSPYGLQFISMTAPCFMGAMTRFEFVPGGIE